MTPTLVLDTSGLIAFTHLRFFSTLSKLYSHLLVPPSVVREFGPLSFPAPLRTESLSERERELVKILQLQLNDGEAEVIALGYTRQWPVILDDRKARQIVVQLSLRVTGTLGVLIKAKQQGLVPSLASLLDQLNQSHFYVSPSLQQRALELSGEG